LGAVFADWKLVVKPMAAPLRRFEIGKALVCAAIGLAGALIILWLRYAGVLQSAELYAYDIFIRLRARDAPATTGQFALVEETEQDVEAYDYPLTDAMLAELLTKIEKQQPAGIGLDLYRDLLEPRQNTTGRAMLEAVLKDNQNIICAYRYGNHLHPFEIPPPKIPPEELSYRAGFSNFPIGDKSVRRAYLYLHAGRNYYDSFPLLLARLEGVTTGSGANGLPRIGVTTIPEFTPNTGGYFNASAGGHPFLLDFMGPQKFPPPWSIGQVIDEKVPGNAFAGKIVLIGEEATSVKDTIMTPVNPQEKGVELHALVTDQLMRMQKGAPAMQAWGPAAQAGWLFLWCAIAAGIGYHCRAPVAFIAAPIGMVGLLIYCCWRAFEASWWIPLVPPLAGSLPVTALVVSFMGYREKMDRNILMSIFCRHVDKGVAEAVWDQRELFMRDQRLVPLRLTATVLFTDLQNFSTVSEKMEPEELLAWINEYMEMLVRHVERYGGMVNKYMGDSIMAVFGAPVPRTTEAEIKRDALNSVKCALAMGLALDQLNIKRREECSPTTNMRVGIYTGPAVSGSIGSRERLEFTVLGDTVNTASRLESFDKSLFSDQTCRILVGESTRELVESHFHLKFVDTIELKGQHEKTGIYYVPRDENCEEGRMDCGGRGVAVSDKFPGAGKHAGAEPASADLPSAGYRG
jgi:adenylate cyclase